MLLFIGATALYGQEFQVNLVMSPNPSPFLSDWEERTETITMIITNLTQNDRLIKVRAQILEGGALRAQTKTPDMPVINLPGLATQTLNAESIVPLQAIELFGTSQDAIIRTGKIPAGTYQICVTLLDAETEQVLTEQVCQIFGVTAHQAPILILPPDGQAINLEQTPTVMFSWTPMTPNFSAPFRYVLQVFEVLTGQDPIQAFQANLPVLEEDVVSATQFLWPPDISFLEDGEYIWSVRVLDEEDRPITDPDGYAEPFVFTVESQGDITDDSQCPECVLQGILMENESDGGDPSTTDGQPKAGDVLLFTPLFQARCPDGSIPRIEGDWILQFITPDGVQTVEHVGSELQFTPPSQGRIEVRFVGGCYLW